MESDVPSQCSKQPDTSLYPETDTTPSHLIYLPSILILYYNLYLCLPSGLGFPSGFPTITLYAFLFSPTYATQYGYLILLNILRTMQTTKLFIMQFDPSSSFFIHLRPKYFPQNPFQTLSDCAGAFETSTVTSATSREISVFILRVWKTQIPLSKPKPGGAISGFNGGRLTYSTEGFRYFLQTLQSNNGTVPETGY